MRWLKLRYVLYVKDTKEVIDSSDDYIIIPIGKDILLKEIEKNLENAEIGKVYDFILKKPYGDRKEENIKIIPINEFNKRGITPKPGLIIDADGMKGIIRNINSGRVIVDFNHPLAGKDLVYRVELVEEVKGLEDKIKGILNFFYRIPFDKINVTIEDKNIKISIKEGNLPDKYKETLTNYIEELKNYKIE
ncbi:hypothetical protein BA065_00310 [Nanoarchaeota archaeon NZ13-N]|nr:MAG: hypothetical protein BA065_00310 [Nanoarchaeota archaeon NZ13-N]